MPTTVSSLCWLLRGASGLALAVALAGCGGGGGASAGASPGDNKTAPPTYRLGGSVSGLNAGAQLTLKLGDGEALTVRANGPYSFAGSVPASGSYNITLTQPAGQTCSVANFSGAGVTADVNNIDVVCAANPHALSGAVSGLAPGAQVTLNNNGSDPVVISANGTMFFPKGVPHNGSYLVTVDAQPAGQTCTVGHGSGSGVVADVGNIAVVCAVTTYHIAGSVSGLSAGQLTLANNGTDFQIVAANGPFTLAMPVAHNGSYGVTVSTQPVGLTCTVNHGSGTGVTSDIGDVEVVCAANAYSIGGNVSGLLAGQQVTLNNNGGDARTVGANGAFTFATAVAHGAGYAVTVATQPVGQVCTVSSGTGTGVVAAVTAVQVNCVTRVAYAYTALSGSNEIAQYSVGADGVLSPLSTAKVAAGSAPVSVTVDPTGRYAYAVNSNSDSVSQYDIGLDGSLTPMATATVTTGAGAWAMAIDPTGRFAYVMNRTASTVSQYRLVDGALEALPGTVGTGVLPIAITVVGSHVYVVNYGGSVSQYAIGTDGSLGAAASTVSTNSPYSMAMAPSGRMAYVANFQANTVSQISVAADGSLGTVVDSFAAGTNPYSVAVDPNGRCAYAANANSANVSQFSIDASTGALLSAAPEVVSAGTGPVSVVVDPTGRFAYVVNFLEGSIYHYAVAADCTLSHTSTVSGLSDPQAIVTTFAR